MAPWSLFTRRDQGTSIAKSRSPKANIWSKIRRSGYQFEPLESRLVMTGPALSQILVDSAVLHNGDIYNQAPREVIIDFDPNQTIDPTSLGGIQFIGSGGDGIFGNGNDKTITPAYINLGKTPNEVVARFDGGLAQDNYQVQIVGAGIASLRNTAQEAFNKGVNQSVSFQVQTAVQILAVVPQPVARSGSSLSPQNNQIVVYFNQDIANSVATRPELYQLVSTAGTLNPTDDILVNPSNPLSVSYDATKRMATLTFNAPLPEGVYRLRVGNNDPIFSTPQVVNVVTDPGEMFSNAANLGIIGGSAGVQTSIVIQGQRINFGDVPGYNLSFPGTNDYPGTRTVPAGSSAEGYLGGADGAAGIQTLSYSFPKVYGVDINGIPLTNQITETQKVRARQIFDLYGYYLGVKFVEVDSGGLGIVTGDPRAADPTVPPSGVGGIAGGGLAIMNSAVNWGASEYGGGWFNTAIHEIGHSLGLLHASDLPDPNVMGQSGDSLVSTNAIPFEPSYPDPAAILHGQVLYRPESRDIDFYKVQVGTQGTLTAQTVAQRLTGTASTLDTVISIYDANFNLIARNDDYYGKDSYIQLSGLATGFYYVAVTSTGNTDFDGRIDDSGMGGISEGTYDLRIDFDPIVKNSVMTGTNGLVLDGDSDGKAGGDFDFWFEAGSTIYVDKAAAPAGNGSAATPYQNIADALQAASRRIVVPASGGAFVKVGDYFSVNNGTNQVATFYFTTSNADPLVDALGRRRLLFATGDTSLQLASKIVTAINGVAGLGVSASAAGAIVTLTPTVSGNEPTLDISGSDALLQTPNIVRIEGNGGADGNISTVSDNLPYIIAPGSADGSQLVVPQGVTLMIDQGTIIKLDGANINVGDSQVNVDRSGAALQILGTPLTRVILTSLNNDAVGGNSPDSIRDPFTGDWGGVVFGPNSDYEKQGIFLNYINGATLSYGGGTVNDSGDPVPYDVITVSGVRPTISNNVIVNNASAAISADPGSFTETDYGKYETFTVDYSRKGLNVHGNTVTDNSFNGLFVRTTTPIDSSTQEFTSYAHFSTTDMVYIIGENILLSQNPGGYRQYSESGTAKLATVNYVVLGDAASSTDDEYTGLTVTVGGQSRKIISYNGLTKIARFDSVITVPLASLAYSISGTKARVAGSLVIDPGAILKLTNSRIEAEMGSHLFAEGTSDRPIILTSIADDSYGAGGTFDTTSDHSSSTPAPGNWAGLYFSPTSSGSLDFVRLTFAGGISDIAGKSATFNPIEIHQANVRIANGYFGGNLGGGSSSDQDPSRDGRGATTQGIVYVQYAQPTIVNNIFQKNAGPAISINADAMTTVLKGDTGRSTGFANAFTAYNENHGILARANVLQDNAINGMLIRGATLTTETIWDDSDIVHVVLNEILIPNLHVFNGLTIKSSAGGSLVVKLFTSQFGQAGITVSGTPIDVDDRIGGSLYIVGTAARPVIMTSLRDDTVGAGYDLFGNAATDTNGDTNFITARGVAPTAGDWRSIDVTQYANDTNVGIYYEKEKPYIGSTVSNNTPATAEYLGNLAANIQSGDDTSRLGYQVRGSIALDNPRDMDVYRFSGIAGSEVWIDVDMTRYALDAIVELVDINGSVLARSQGNSPSDLQNFQLSANSGPFTMDKNSTLAGDPNNQGDFYSINPKDPGMRLVLPGQTGQRQDYYVRIRSNPQPTDTMTGIDNAQSGLSRGEYQLNIRLQQVDMKPGTTIQYADVRYATNGITVSGQPLHSPLTGEAGDVEQPGQTGQNDNLASAQKLGNLLGIDRNTISVGGFLSNLSDVDWYQFTVDFDFLQTIAGLNAAGLSWSTIFDIDYADGITGPDTTLSVFDSKGNLILVGNDSNVADDRTPSGGNPNALSGGSYGANDPYIGTAQLPTGRVGSASQTYYVAVSSKATAPKVLSQFYEANSTTPLIRIEPVDSINRVVEDHIGLAGYIPVNPSSGSGGATGAAAPLTSAAAKNPLFGNLPNVNSATSVSVNANPYTLSDVVLFVVRGGALYTYNPYTGAMQTAYGDGSMLINGNTVSDILMRPDGLLFAYSNGDSDTNTGNYNLIDTGTAAKTNRGDDGVALHQTYGSNGYTALAVSGLDPGNVNNDGFLVYAFDDQNRIYWVNPNTGAVLVPSGAQIPFRGTVSGSGQTLFTIPSATTGANMADESIITAGGKTFEISKPLGIVVNNVPDVNLVRPKDLIFTYIDSANQTVTVELDTNGVVDNAGANVRVSLNGLNAGAADAGLLAQRIVIALNNRQPGSASFVNNEIVINGAFSFSGLNDTNGTKILTVDPAMKDGRVAVGANTAISISNFSTATEIGQAIRNAFSAQGLQAGLSTLPNGDVQVSLTSSTQPTSNIPPGSLQINFTPGVGIGSITGAATVQPNYVNGNGSSAGENLYVVTDEGYLLRINRNNGALLSIDPNNPGTANNIRLSDSNGNPFRFTGLTRGPLNVEGSVYKNILFATTSDGKMVAIDVTPGKVPALAPVLAGGKSVITLEVRGDVSSSGATPLALAFSTLDFNLWQPSARQATDPGHGINNTFDGSRTAGLTLPASEVAGGMSYRFGMDLTDSDKALVNMYNASVYRFRGQGNNGSAVVNTYDLPGGAHGTLTTNSFSLKGYSSLDKPTLYFNYFLDTESAASQLQGTINTMRDSLRVYISDDGINWHELTTNNSTRALFFGTGGGDSELPESYTYSGGQYQNQLPGAQGSQSRVQETFDNTGWRQARVDLGDFAGMSNLQLRFDFATAGDTDEAAKLKIDLPAATGSAGLLGTVLNMALYGGPAGANFQFTLDPANVLSGNLPIVITAGMSNEEVAIAIAKAVNDAATAGKISNFTAQAIGNLGTTANRTVIATKDMVEFNTNIRNTRVVITPVTDLTAKGISVFSSADQPARFGPVGIDGQIQYLPGDEFGNFESTSKAQNNNHQGAFIDDIIIGFAERGEMVTRPSGTATSESSDFQALPVNRNPSLPIPQLVGAYQLEIRRGTEYGNVFLENAAAPGQPAPLALFQSFDTNDRLSDAWIIQTLAGSQIANGTGFVINDGYRSVSFEFTRTGTVTAGRVALLINDAMTADRVADVVALAVRNATSQGKTLNVFASTLNLETSGAQPRPNSNQVILYSVIDIDYLTAANVGTIVQYGTQNGRSGFYNELGDSNLTRLQGTIIIANNTISNVSQVGINVQMPSRDEDTNLTAPGAVRNVPGLNTKRQVPGTVITNNVVYNFGAAGIRFAGDADATGNLAPVPFGRIVNNTIFGGLTAAGIGIDVLNNAAPTLMNNIIANTLTGIRIDASSKSETVELSNLFQGNSSDKEGGALGSYDLVQAATTPIFVDPSRGNFQLRPGTSALPNLAVDSANNSLDDRTDLLNVRLALGMLASPIIAPDQDQKGQKRVDDPTVTSPPGLGSNTFKDRGAIERVDFFGPYASLITPLDNGPTDTNTATNDVSISGGVGTTKFEIKLVDLIGGGVDQQSVNANDVVITLGGQTLTQGTDYTFKYDLTRDVIVLTSTGAQFRAGSYQIILNNSATGILDKAGNPVISNRTDKRTLFNVVIALTGPTGLLTAPLDGGPSDLNSAANDVTVKTAQGLSVLEVSLTGGVGGIKDSSVDSSKVQLLQNDKQLVLGTDYLFSYDPTTDKIRLTSVGQLFIPGKYTILVDDSLDNGILDASGSPIQPNRNNGTVAFNATLLLAGPIAVVSSPADNGPLDTNLLANHVQVVSTSGLPKIDIVLNKDSAAINAATVTASTVKLFRDGKLLVRGTDYNFAYIAGTSTISLTLTDLTKVPASYKVVLDNSASTGIRDLSGARLQPNEPDGTTDFFVSIDAPGPVAALISPLDGSSIDKDPTPNNVLFYSQAAVTQFQVLLGQVGFAINDSTVLASKVSVTRDGILLQQGTDYAFTYQASIDTITISSIGSDFQPGQYDIKLDNSANGILDVQGNQLRPNRASGTTELIVSFTPPGPISIPQGIFIANLGLSDISGVTYVGFNLQGDPLSKLTVTVDAKVDPSGASTQLVNTTLFVSANGLLTFSKLLPVDVNGESLTITVTNEYGQVITASSLIGPRATLRRAYVSSLFDNLLGRDGVLNETTDQFTPIESLVTFPAMAQSIVNSVEFASKAAAALVQNLLGRAATPQEIATYSTQFLSTGSFNQARITLLTSDEFAKLPSDAALNYNDANHRALVTSYVQRVYAVLLPGVTLTPALLNTQVQNVFEGGRRWIISNSQDGGILASAIYHQIAVNKTFNQLLGRNATTAEQNAYGNLSDRDLLKAVVTTTDYIYTQLVQSIYREYLQLGKGQVDPAKVQALVQALKNGETENEARADVLATTDFRTNAGGTLAAFVENAYRQVLLRTPSASDITTGINFVNANGGDIVAGRRAYALLLLSDPSYQNNGQGTLITAGIQSAESGSPVISGISQVQLSEGQKVQFTVASTPAAGSSVVYNLAVAPAGATIDSLTGKFTWTPPDNYMGLMPVTIEAVDGSNSRLRTIRTFLVDVGNIAPTATVYAPSYVVGGTQQSVTLTAVDPSSVDSNANFTFDIDWNGDGVSDEVVVGPSGVVVQHAFYGAGWQTVNVTATDKDGGTSDAASTSVFVGGVFIEPDPTDPTKNNLIVVGTDGADVITLSQDSSSGPVTVTLSMLNGLAVNIIQQFANITGHIEVFTAGGDDIVHAEGVKYTALKIDSGAGNDSLAGGYKNDTILAGDGNDTIWGLIGNDSIDGGAGDDLIFGDQPGGYGYSPTSSNIGNDTILGGTGNDTIYGDSDGGEGKSDYIDAGDGDDMVVADGPEGSSTANDTIYGGNGNDLIFADHPTTSPDLGGKDSVDGGSGADIIYGGGGADSLSGGSGSDLVIAGYVNNLGISTFQNVQREWVSADSFLDRRAYISAQKIFGGANGSSYLVPGGSTTLNGNVLDDNAVDSIFAGNDTDGDWLLATAALDDLHDIHLNEDIVDSLVKV